MEYRKLGNTDLNVSRIILGCEPLGGTDWGDFNLEDAKNAVRHALELGINTFDVADVYGLGQAEEVLAEALGQRRHDSIIITKFGVNWRTSEFQARAETFRDASPKHVRSALEASLRRLKIEYIPLYLIHWPDPNTPIEDTIEALLQCQDE